MKLTVDIAFATAFALGSLCAGAAAAPVDISSGSAGFVSTPGAVGFSDIYTFTLSSPTTVNVLLSSVVGGGQDVDFTSVILNGPAGVFNAAEFTGDPFESWTIENVALTPGSYTLTANGSNSAAAGTYVGNIALSGSSSSSPGGPGGPLDLSTGSSGFVHTPAAGAFADIYTFTLASTRAVNVMLSSVIGGLQDIDFTSLILKGPSGEFAAAQFTKDPFENWTLSTPLLDPGSYTLTASGTNSDAVGTYVGSIAVSATGPTPPNSVPEPGSLALLLAGLAAARATRRRYKARPAGAARHQDACAAPRQSAWRGEGLLSARPAV